MPNPKLLWETTISDRLVQDELGTLGFANAVFDSGQPSRTLCTPQSLRIQLSPLEV
jgi:hypothetical protein